MAQNIQTNRLDARMPYNLVCVCVCVCVSFSLCCYFVTTKSIISLNSAQKKIIAPV